MADSTPGPGFRPPEDPPRPSSAGPARHAPAPEAYPPPAVGSGGWRSPWLSWLVLLFVVVFGLMLWRMATPTGPTDSDPVPPRVPGSTPTVVVTQVVTTPGQTTDPRDVNPGYQPEETGGPFASPRPSRGPVLPPSATPTQTWPTFPDGGRPLAGWTTVDAADRGSYEIPSGWTYHDGLFIGYETMRGLSVAATYISKDRENECGGTDEYSFMALLKPSPGGSAAKAAPTIARQWAEAANTQYEGDYYDVPEPASEPFTFADGRTGALATVTFVPVFADEYSCPAPAVRFTVVSLTSGTETYSAVVRSAVGLPESLSEKAEREILARYRPPA